MRSIVIRLLVVAMFVLVPFAARGEGLADRVPKDAILFIGWEGADKLKASYQGTHLKAVLDASSIPEFFEKKLPAIVERLAEGDPIAKHAMGALATAWRYPTVVYVGPVDMTGEMPMPRVAVVCDAGTEAAVLEKRIAALLEQAGPAPLAVKREGDRVMLEIGKVGEGAEAMLMGKPTNMGPVPLSAEKAYQAAVAHVQKGAAVTVYVSIPGFVQLGDELATKFGDTREWPRIRDALNLKGLREAAFTAGFDGKDWMVQGFIGLEGPRTGLLALFNSAPVTDDQLKIIPENATWAAAKRGDLAKLFAEAMAAIQKAAPADGREMARDIEQLNSALGVNIEKDVLAALGDAWSAYSSPTVAGNGIFGLVIVNITRDAPRLSAAIDKLEKAANEALSHERAPDGMRIRRTTVSGVEVHHMPLFVVNPSWAIKDGKLFVALSPQGIPAAMDEASGKRSILDNPSFIAMRKRLGVEKPTAVWFVDLPRTAPDAYAFLSMVSTVAQTLAGEDAPPTLIPPLNKLLPELTPAGMAMWTDSVGWHIKCVSPMPASMLLAGAPGTMLMSPALMAGLMMPSMGRARELSNRSLDAANLRGVAMSCFIYATENGDAMPEHLAVLVAKNYVSPRTLVRKGSSTTPAVLTPEQLEAATKDWHKIEKTIDEHCDYVYVGKGLKAQGDANLIVAFTKPWLPDSAEGINIVYADGHVEWTMPRSIEAAFEETNKKRKELKLEAVDIEKMMERMPRRGRGQLDMPPPARVRTIPPSQH